MENISDKYYLELLRTLSSIEKYGMDDTQATIDMQLLNFGFYGNGLRKLKNKIVLDFGCGRKGNLVCFLRNRKVLAEGIDEKLELESDFLFKKKIEGLGSIHREDSYYDFILSHLNNSINSPIIFDELLRVLNQEGKMMVYPAIVNMVEIKYLLKERRFRIKREPIVVANQLDNIPHPNNKYCSIVY